MQAEAGSKQNRVFSGLQRVIWQVTELFTLDGFGEILETKPQFRGVHRR
jgi:hypothetical protein